MKKKKLKKELAITLYRLEVLANMVLDLEATEIGLSDCEYVITPKEDFDLMFDYVHRDICGIK